MPAIIAISMLSSTITTKIVNSIIVRVPVNDALEFLKQSKP